LDFNLQVSPCSKLKPAVLIGSHTVRQRVLKDYEIAALWRASEKIGYPFGTFFQLLLLTALRRNEASEAKWSEIDLKAKLWVIPGARMKNGASHAVPLVPKILDLLERLPKFKGGDYLFSTTDGEKPVSGFSKAKKRLNALMRADLESQGLQFEDFVIHDIRRTCRTRFSALPVEEIVRELLLAHARPGLHKVYDQHAYEKEKADALKLWHANLRRNIIDVKSPSTFWRTLPDGSNTESFPASGKRRTRHPHSGKPWGIGRLQTDSTFIHKGQLGVTTRRSSYLNKIPLVPLHLPHSFLPRGRFHGRDCRVAQMTFTSKTVHDPLVESHQASCSAK
jgi:hypothetical protein